jgi:tetratricopeptide (TPR) repeat protein
MIDPNNPVVKLCAAGMRAEGEGRFEEARSLFNQAWEAKTDGFEACIAAHYVARHQASPQDTLRWNQEALAWAEAVGDERVRDFFPSLYLNLGYSYEQLGDKEEARRCYDLAAERAGSLPEDRYGGIVRNAIECRIGLRKSKL